MPVAKDVSQSGPGLTRPGIGQNLLSTSGVVTMPSGNQGRPQDQGRHRNGAAGGGGREEGQDVGQRLQEGAGQVAQHVREGYDSARDELGRRYRRAEGMMARNPAPSVLMGFGIGF